MSLDKKLIYMKVKVRKIGNSVGIILSKAIVDQCGIKDEVTLEVKGDAIIIQPVTTHPREGWEEQFLKAGSLEDNEMLMGDLGNSFDEDEWTW